MSRVEASAATDHGTADARLRVIARRPVSGPGATILLHRLGAALLFLAAGLVQAVPAQEAKPEPGASLYAVNAASIATAMTYCMGKHGPLRVGSPAEVCFREARNLLAGYGLKSHAERIDRLCRDPARFNTCITPEIGRLVIALNAHLEERIP